MRDSHGPLQKLEALTAKVKLAPECVVIGPATMKAVRLHASRTMPPDSDDPHGLSNNLFGLPMYVFEDVPETEVVFFSNRKTYHRYLDLRESLGHSAAVQRMKAAVEDGLVIQAELNALLNRS